MAVLRAPGELLYYEEVPALADRVFIRPQWLVDVMKELVRHDLESVVDGMADSSDGAGAAVADFKLQATAAQFVQTGVVSLDVLQWLWRRAGILQPDSDAALPAQLVELLRQLSIVLDWWPAPEDGVQQWLMPLWLPGERLELPIIIVIFSRL
jgi:hypothetical protein